MRPQKVVNEVRLVGAGRDGALARHVVSPAALAGRVEGVAVLVEVVDLDERNEVVAAVGARQHVADAVDEGHARRLDRRGRLRRVVLREQVEGPPRRRAELFVAADARGGEREEEGGEEGRERKKEERRKKKERRKKEFYRGDARDKMKNEKLT